MKKSLAALGVSASLIGGGAVGAAMFAPSVAVAQDDVVDTADLDLPDPGDHLAEILAPLVEDGTIDQPQAEAVIAALLDARPERGEFGHRPGFGGGQKLEEVTGIAADVWIEGFRNGDSAAEIAEANGSSAQELIDALVAAATEHIQQEVADGRIDQETADERLADLTDRITDQVNGDGPLFGGPGAGFGRRHR